MNEWPVVKSYDGENLRRIALPLGGIGTGTVSLGGRGNLQDWAIMNTPAIGYTPTMKQGMRDLGPFFALFTDRAGEKRTLVLEGSLDTEHFESCEGAEIPNHGLPRFRDCRFDAAYPMAQVHLSDEEMPLDVTLKAFTPLIPGESDRSALPGAVLTYELTNTGSDDVEASVCGTIINIIGEDGREYRRDWRWNGKTWYRGNRRSRNTLRREEGLTGIHMTAPGVKRSSAAWGDMALSTDSDGRISSRTAWAERTWGDSTLDFWDEFSESGVLTEREAPAPFNRMASLAVKQTVPAGESRVVRFFLTWRFPNRETWHPLSYKAFNRLHYLWHGRIGNHYCTRFADAWQAAGHLKKNLPSLTDDSLKFTRAVLSADLPEEVKEAALFNTSTLRTQTTFRSRKGHFYGWEGIHDSAGSCMGSCTHVWNYEQTTAHLFGDLARSMREVEFSHSTRKDGHMRFRTHLPMWLNRFNRGIAAADGQMGTIMKMYREWQLSGNDTFLAGLWPKVKKALEFCWLPGGWDGDADGVTEGCQHNTMDVEYYGPNPQMQGWYLGALRAAEEMSRHLGESAFADRCRSLFEAGSRFMDEELFNGEYYEHRIAVPRNIRRGLTAAMGSRDLESPILQLGAGCLVDQLVGQYMAHVCGLGYLVKKENVRTTLKSIMKYNFRDDFHHHFNHLRSYVLNDESGLLMASYPKGNRPEQPFPYCNEVMTGFEHSTAAHMLYEGREDDELHEAGLKVISAIRARYDGKRRNPYDEAECGHHYARAMAAWAHILALSGFHWSAVTGEMRFHDRPGRWFWSNGSAWGTLYISEPGSEGIVDITVLSGSLELKRLAIGERSFTVEKVLLSGDREELVID